MGPVFALSFDDKCCIHVCVFLCVRGIVQKYVASTARVNIRDKEVFFDEKSGVEQIISLQIFNRWGAMIFEQNNFIPINGATNWKGDFKGKPLNTGVYVYQIKVAFEDSSLMLLSGDVTLIR